jgi:hypothetical protein
MYQRYGELPGIVVDIPGLKVIAVTYISSGLQQRI